MQNENKGFIASLYDISFTEFITTRVIKVVFLVGLLYAAWTCLVLAFGGPDLGFWKRLLMWIISPVVFVLLSISIRISCEMIVALFRIAENTTPAPVEEKDSIADSAALSE